MVFWLAVLAVLLSLRPWQWFGAGAGLRWRRNGKAAWAPGGVEGSWQAGWRLTHAATAVGVGGGLLLLLVLAAGGPRHSPVQATGDRPAPLAGAALGSRSELADPRDIVLTVTTTVKSSHTSVTRTLFLDSIFVSLASYRCAGLGALCWASMALLLRC